MHLVRASPLKFTAYGSTGVYKWILIRRRCMTTTAGDPVLELQYPKAFATAFAPTLSRHGKAFRYLHLSGAMVEQDQNKALWMAPTMRKIKVRTSAFIVEIDGLHFQPVVHSNVHLGPRRASNAGSG